MKFNEQAVREAARRFFSSRHPMALLRVPGCGPVALSPAHLRSKLLSYPGDRRALVKTIEEYLTVFHWVAAGKGEKSLTTSRRKYLNKLACYCGEVRSILALRPEDCVHESHFRRFQAYGTALVSQSGWEFNLASSRSDRLQSRVYHVIRTGSRLLAVTDQITNGLEDGILELRQVPSEYLRLVVVGEPDSGRLKGRVELIDSSKSRRLVIPEFFGDLVDIEAYRNFDADLRAALESPSNAPAMLAEAARKYVLEANYPVEEIIRDLLVSNPSAAELKRRIRSVRARLWDAPIIAGPVRRQLEVSLATLTQGSLLNNASLDVQRDFADLTMPLIKLERGDLYLPAA